MNVPALQEWEPPMHPPRERGQESECSFYGVRKFMNHLKGNEAEWSVLQEMNTQILC
jgi:hypothetical protein